MAGFIQVADKCVSYDVFIKDLALAIAPLICKQMVDGTDVISQRKAFRIYGQGNVKRWLATGKLVPLSKRPGKIEIRINDLERCNMIVQDYL